MIREVNKARAKPRGITEVELVIYMKRKGESRLEFEGLTGKEFSLQVKEGTTCKGTGLCNEHYMVHSWKPGKGRKPGGENETFLEFF